VPSRVHAWIHGEERPPPEGRAAPAAPTGTLRAIAGEGEAFVPAAPETVWRTLLDPAALARVVPGCSRLVASGENAYEATVDIGVGPVRGRFEASVRLSDLAPPRAARLSGSLLGPLGSSHGAGSIRLEPHEGGTRVAYDYEVHLAGKVAAVGGRMLDGATRILIRQFFAALARQAAPAARAVPWWRALLRRLGLGA